MPHDYIKTKRQYRTEDGYVSRQELRAKIQKLSDTVTRDAGKLAAKFDAGELSAADFNLAMRELLKSAHIVASTVGRGGRDQMTASDWGRVARKIKWQYGYLDRFTQKLERGTLSKANTINRAKQYVSSVYISYADSFREAQTEPVTLESGKVITDENMLCRLVQNSAEGCAECTADAAEGWMPVAEMGELGSRICGDFCLCEIEFEDEVGINE